MTRLASLSLSDFAAALASDTPAPGGGSAAAAGGAAGAALLAMVVRLTLGKEKYKDAWEELTPLADRLDNARTRLLELVDEDTKAFDGVVAARRLMNLSSSFDHRVVDGAVGADFVQSMRGCLEHPAMLFVE